MNEKRTLLQIPFFWIGSGLLCALLWASAPAAIKRTYVALAISTADTPALFLLAGLRFMLAGLLTLVLYWLREKRPPLLTRASAGRVALLALLQTALHYALYFMGVARTSGANASIMSAMQSFLLVILAHFLLRDDPLNPRKLIAIVCGLSGILLLNLGQPTNGATLSGDLLIGLASLFAALSTILMRRLVRNLDTFRMTGWQLFLGGLLLTAAGWFGGGRITVWNLEGLLFFVYLALVSAAAFTLWGALLSQHRASRVGIFNSLIPVFGLFLSWLLLGEDVLRPRSLLASLLVGFGVWLISADPSPQAFADAKTPRD